MALVVVVVAATAVVAAAAASRRHRSTGPPLVVVAAAASVVAAVVGLAVVAAWPVDPAVLVEMTYPWPLFNPPFLLLCYSEQIRFSKMFLKLDPNHSCLN